jgi:hypothetical protein
MVSAPELLAGKSGRCKLCRRPIRAGQDYIIKIADRYWCHAHCAAGYRRVLAEQEEDAA